MGVSGFGVGRSLRTLENIPLGSLLTCFRQGCHTVSFKGHYKGTVGFSGKGKGLEFGGFDVLRGLGLGDLRV